MGNVIDAYREMLQDREISHLKKKQLKLEARMKEVEEKINLIKILTRSNTILIDQRREQDVPFSIDRQEVIDLTGQSHEIGDGSSPIHESA